MSEEINIRFYEVRVDALKKWERITNRDFETKYSKLGNDNFEKSYECFWQELYEDKHVHVFCSMGEWANNVTDILQDNNYDYLYMSNEEESKILFRYYTRLLLVVSEFITDFEDIVIEYLQIGRNESRRILSNGYHLDEPINSLVPNTKPEEICNSVNVLMNYINSVCKHKFGKASQNKLHRFNNHLEYQFQMNQIIAEIYLFNNEVNEEKANSILVPNLDLILDIISNCYIVLNNLFTNEENKDKFLEFCKNNSD